MKRTKAAAAAETRWLRRRRSTPMAELGSKKRESNRGLGAEEERERERRERKGRWGFK